MLKKCLKCETSMDRKRNFNSILDGILVKKYNINLKTLLRDHFYVEKNHVSGIDIGLDAIRTIKVKKIKEIKSSFKEWKIHKTANTEYKTIGDLIKCRDYIDNYIQSEEYELKKSHIMDDVVTSLMFINKKIDEHEISFNLFINENSI